MNGGEYRLFAIIIFIAGCLPTFAALCLSPESIISLVSDDAFYYFNVARLAGSLPAPSFDGLTITTGFHPLFGAITTALSAWTPIVDMPYVRAVLVLNGLLNLLATLGIYKTCSHICNPHIGRIGALLFVFNPFIALLPLTGMEASLSMACIAWFLACWVRLDYGNLSKAIVISACLIAALCVYARIDNWIIVMAACGAILVGPERRTQRFGISMAIGSAATFALLSWMLLCYQWSGEWLQGSALMKSWFREIETAELSLIGHSIFSFELASNYLIKGIVKVPALLIFTIYLIYSGRLAFRWSNSLLMWLGAPIALAIAYGIKLPHVQTWYFASILVLWTVLAGIMASRLIAVSKLKRNMFWVLILVVFAGVFTTKLVRGRNIGQRDMLHAAKTVSETVSPDARIGSWNAGIYGYFSERQVINLDGLINNEIYRAVEDGALNWPYWEKRKITHLLDYERWLIGHPLNFEGKRLVELHRYPAKYAEQDIVLMAISPASDLEGEK